MAELKENKKCFAETVKIVGEVCGYVNTYLVGGAVRDVLSELPPNDLDFVVDTTTNGLSWEKLVQSFKEHPAVGNVSLSNYGVLIVTLLKGPTFEVAHARSETYGGSGYKPVSTAPASIEEDMRRRDFTINALYVDLADVLVDEKDTISFPWAELSVHDYQRTPGESGVDDLLNRRLRACTDPFTMFADDPSRLLRMVRLELYAFDADKELVAAACLCAKLLREVPHEQILKYLDKLREHAPHVREMLDKLDDFGLSPVLENMLAESLQFLAAWRTWASTFTLGHQSWFPRYTLPAGSTYERARDAVAKIARLGAPMTVADGYATVVGKGAIAMLVAHSLLTEEQKYALLHMVVQPAFGCNIMELANYLGIATKDISTYANRYVIVSLVSCLESDKLKAIANGDKDMLTAMAIELAQKDSAEERVSAISPACVAGLRVMLQHAYT